MTQTRRSAQNQARNQRPCPTPGPLPQRPNPGVVHVYGHSARAGFETSPGADPGPGSRLFRGRPGYRYGSWVRANARAGVCAPVWFMGTCRPGLVWRIYTRLARAGGGRRCAHCPALAPGRGWGEDRVWHAQKKGGGFRLPLVASQVSS